jgi:hypothetical protein
MGRFLIQVKIEFCWRQAAIIGIEKEPVLGNRFHEGTKKAGEDLPAQVE